MKFDHCPLCNSPRIVTRKAKRSLVFKNRTVITPVIEYWLCKNCEEVFYPPASGKKLDESLLTHRKRKAG